jgi:hypothetical protein
MGLEARSTAVVWQAQLSVVDFRKMLSVLGARPALIGTW